MGQLGSSQGPLPLYIVDLGDFHQKNVKGYPYFKDILSIFTDVRIENWKNKKKIIGILDLDENKLFMCNLMPWMVPG